MITIAFNQNEKRSNGIIENNSGMRNERLFMSSSSYFCNSAIREAIGETD